MSEQTPSTEQTDAPEAATPAPRPVPAPAPPAPAPAPPAPRAPSPAALAGLHAPGGQRASEFGRVADDGTVFVRTAEGEREVGSYPGATPAEALAYFTRKYDELLASAELLLQRVTHTDLGAKEAGEGLAKLREQSADARVVGDLALLETKVQAVAAAVQTKRGAEDAERRAAREAGRVQRETLVAEAESIAAQPENKVQWKASGARMRALLDEWKAMQRSGPKLDRESETSLWQRFSAARNGFDKARRVHFAQLEGAQSEAKAAKQKLVAEAEALATSTDWAPTATAFKRLMDRWRDAGRASRTDDDALWARFKAAQDAFFAAKDEVVAAENVEYQANLQVKEDLLTQAQALLPVPTSRRPRRRCARSRTSGRPPARCPAATSNGSRRPCAGWSRRSARRTRSAGPAATPRRRPGRRAWWTSWSRGRGAAGGPRRGGGLGQRPSYGGRARGAGGARAMAGPGPCGPAGVQPLNRPGAQHPGASLEHPSPRPVRRAMHFKCSMLHSWIGTRRTSRWPSAHGCDRCGSRGDGRSTGWPRSPG